MNKMWLGTDDFAQPGLSPNLRRSSPASVDTRRPVHASSCPLSTFHISATLSKTIYICSDSFYNFYAGPSSSDILTPVPPLKERGEPFQADTWREGEADAASPFRPLSCHGDDAVLRHPHAQSHPLRLEGSRRSRGCELRGLSTRLPGLVESRKPQPRFGRILTDPTLRDLLITLILAPII
jgi:hypothetical protein